MDSTTEMDIPRQILYAQCWTILGLYILTNLFMLRHKTCIGSAASFLFSCTLWIDLTLFNFWFFLPSFVGHIARLEFDADNKFASLKAIITSDAAQDIYLMLLGWVGGCLSVSNAASILETDGCIASEPHTHRGISTSFIKLAYRLRDYVGLESSGAISLPTCDTVNAAPRRRSVIFAIPRLFYVHTFRRASVSSDHNRPSEKFPAEKAELVG